MAELSSHEVKFCPPAPPDRPKKPPDPGAVRCSFFIIRLLLLGLLSLYLFAAFLEFSDGFFVSTRFFIFSKIVGFSWFSSALPLFPFRHLHCLPLTENAIYGSEGSWTLSERIRGGMMPTVERATRFGGVNVWDNSLWEDRAMLWICTCGVSFFSLCLLLSCSALLVFSSRCAETGLHRASLAGTGGAKSLKALEVAGLSFISLFFWVLCVVFFPILVFLYVTLSCYAIYGHRGLEMRFEEFSNMCYAREIEEWAGKGGSAVSCVESGW